MTKPVVKIQNAFIIGNRLHGEAINYPVEHEWFPGAVHEGQPSEVVPITTSLIVSVNGDTVETQRTIYEVQNWVGNKTLS